MAQLSGVMTADFSQFRIEVDKSVVKLQEFQRAGVSTDTTLGGMADGLSQVDKTLNLFGVHLGPQIQAMRELGTVAGLTFEKLGLWGSLGAIGATFAASWQLTTWALQFTTLDESIADATASLLGWGDVAAANAGAQTELFARATQLAGRSITDLNEALKIVKASNDAMSASMNTGTARLSEWDRQISTLRARGDLPAIERALKDKSSTLKELAVEYGVSERALSHYMDRTNESSAILKKWRENEQAGIEKQRKAQDELNQAGDGWRNTLTTIAPVTAAAVTQYLAMDASQTALATKYGLTTFQVQALDKALKEQTATLARNEPALGTLTQFMAGLAPEIRKAGENMMFFDQQLMASIATVEAEAVPALEKLDTTFRSVTEAVREAAAPSKNAPGSVPINVGNISFGPGGLEAAFNKYSAGYNQSSVGAIGGGPPKDFLSWALSMGLASRAPVVNNTFNVVDTESEIARRVSEEISRQIQRGSLVQ